MRHALVLLVAVPLSAIMRLASPFTDIFVGATTRALALFGLRETRIRGVPSQSMNLDCVYKPSSWHTLHRRVNTRGSLSCALLGSLPSGSTARREAFVGRGIGCRQ